MIPLIRADATPTAEPTPAGARPLFDAKAAPGTVVFGDIMKGFAPAQQETALDEGADLTVSDTQGVSEEELAKALGPQEEKVAPPEMASVEVLAGPRRLTDRTGELAAPQPPASARDAMRGQTQPGPNIADPQDTLPNQDRLPPRGSGPSSRVATEMTPREAAMTRDGRALPMAAGPNGTAMAALPVQYTPQDRLQKAPDAPQPDQTGVAKARELSPPFGRASDGVLPKPDPAKVDHTKGKDVPARETVLSAPTDTKNVAKSAAPTPAVALSNSAGTATPPFVDGFAKSFDRDGTANAAAIERVSPATSSGTLPTTASPTTNTPPETARHVASQIAVAINNGPAKSTEIALSPAELGRVRLSLSAADSAIVLNVMAERPETQDLLRRHIDVLAQEFRQLGYSSISFTFGEQSGNPTSNTPAFDMANEPDLIEETAELGATIGQVGAGLDIRI